MFEKGKSGNPSGRPKMTEGERDRWKALALKCLDKLEAMADDPETPPGIVVKITEISAARSWGQPMQAVELSGDEDRPVKLVQIIAGKHDPGNNTSGGNTAGTESV